MIFSVLKSQSSSSQPPMHSCTRQLRPVGKLVPGLRAMNESTKLQCRHRKSRTREIPPSVEVVEVFGLKVKIQWSKDDEQMYVEEEYLKHLLILAGSNSDQSIEESRFKLNACNFVAPKYMVIIQNSDTPKGYWVFTQWNVEIVELIRFLIMWGTTTPTPTCRHVSSRSCFEIWQNLWTLWMPQASDLSKELPIPSTKNPGCSELKGYFFWKETPSVSESSWTSQSPTISTSTFFWLSLNRPSNRSWKPQPRETRCLPLCCSSGTRWSSWRSLGHCLAIFLKLECSDAEKVQNRKIQGHNTFLEIRGEPEVGPALKVKPNCCENIELKTSSLLTGRETLWEAFFGKSQRFHPETLPRWISLLKHTGRNPQSDFLSQERRSSKKSLCSLGT